MVICNNKASTLSCFLVQELNKTIKTNAIETNFFISFFLNKTCKTLKTRFTYVGSPTGLPTEAAGWQASTQLLFLHVL